MEVEVEVFGEVGEAEVLGEAPVGIDDVFGLVGGGDAVGVEEGGGFAGAGEAEAGGGGGGVGDEGGAEEALEVEDEVEFLLAEVPEEADEVAGGGEAAGDLAVIFAVEGDDLVEVGGGLEEFGAVGAEEPGEVGVGIVGAEAG